MLNKLKRPGTRGPDDSTEPPAPTAPDAARLHTRGETPKTRTVSKKILIGAVCLGAIVFVTAGYFGLGGNSGGNAEPGEMPDPEGGIADTPLPKQLASMRDTYTAEDFAPPPVPDPVAPPTADAPQPSQPAPQAPPAPARDMTLQYTPPPPQPSGPSPEVQARMQEAEAARTADPFFSNPGGEQASQQASAPQQGQGGASAPPPSGQSYSGGQQSAGYQNASTDQGSKRSFMESGETSLYLAQQPVQPIGQYEVKSPTMIPLVLTTAINSDLPGRVVARTSSNIYDSATGEHVLIPYGSVVEGEYDSSVAYGQQRILIRWDELTLPNGTSLVLDGMVATDGQGRAGLHANVDRHLFRLGGAVLLSGAFSVLGEVATDDDDQGGSITGDVGDAVSIEAARVGGRIVDRELNVQPTLRAEVGTTLHLMVTKDILLQPYRESQ